MRRGPLTASGWPRPLTPDGKLPVPWIAPARNLGMKDWKRQRRVAGGWICQVCGERLGSDERVYCFANIDAGPADIPVGERLPEEMGVQAMDFGLLHRRCARLALAHCPALKRMKNEEVLAICEVPSGAVVAYGEDVLVVSADALRPPRAGVREWLGMRGRG